MTASPANKPQITDISGQIYRGIGQHKRFSSTVYAGKPCNPDCDPGCCDPQCEPSICDPEVCPPDACKPLCDPYRCTPEDVCAPDACMPNCDPKCCPKEPCGPDGPCNPSPTIQAFSAEAAIEFQPYEVARSGDDSEFTFYPWVKVEEGAVNGAILNFKNKDVVSVNAAALPFVKAIEDGVSLESLFNVSKAKRSDVIDLVNQLADQRLLTLSGTEGFKFDHLPEVELRSGLQFLWLEVTSGCNLKCVHCYAECGTEDADDYVADANKRSRVFKNMSAAKMCDIITQAAQSGCRMIQFIGGEPTMHPKLLDMVQHAADQGFSFIEVYTNGTWLSDKMLEAFKRLGVHLAISYYSHVPEIHESITAIPGSHKMTMDALKKIKAMGIPFRIGIVVMKQNEETLAESKQFLIAKGYAETVRADALRPSGRGVEELNAPQNYDPVLRRPSFRADWTEYNVNSTRNSCWHGKIAVSTTGDVMPCIFSRDEIMGNLQDNDLEHVLKNAHTQKLWHLTHDDVAICSSCEYRNVCRDCRALPLNSDGDLVGKSPRCGYNPQTGIWADRP